MIYVPPQNGPSVTGREGGDQNHSTSCLFLQRFVESEREFLNSLFLTSPSTFVLHGIPLLESLLVASSILCISIFFPRVRILFERACASPPLQLSPRQWLFPHHLCGSLLLLWCLQRGVWVLTAIY